MKVLELFAGSMSVGKAFKARGHEVYSIDWDSTLPGIDMCADIMTVTAQDIFKEFGKPDVIWASPDCTSYSVAAIGHHRKKNRITGNLDPVTDYAKYCDQVNAYLINLIREIDPKFFFIENPRGGMRKMSFMKDLPRYTVTYCFSGDTRFITRDGHRSFKEMEGQEVEVLNQEGKWEKAAVHKYGNERLYKLILSRSGKKKVIHTTANHKWIAAPRTNKWSYSEIETVNLQKGMFLPFSIPDKKQVEIIPEYVCRGFVFGDGHVLKSKPSAGSFAQFCGEKNELLPYFDGFGGKRWRDDKNGLKITKLCSLPNEWKTDIPKINDDYSKIFSWIAGYFAADGSCDVGNGQLSISSSKKENLQAVKELAEMIGIGSYSISEHQRKGYGKEETALYQMTFMRSDVDVNMLLRSRHREAFLLHSNVKHQARRWSVVSVEPTDTYADVYCCETESSGTFTLEDNVVTHNCKYGDIRMKPTDIWTNHPDPKFKPPCKNGDPCHIRAPRGARTGTQGLDGAKKRAVIPKQLCEHVVDICEEMLQKEEKKMEETVKKTMTIRQLINVLIDAPNKDGDVEVEYVQKEVEDNANGFEWNQLAVISAVPNGVGCILEAHPKEKGN